MAKLTFSDIKSNPEFTMYIEKGNEQLGVLGYTDHSEQHTLKVGGIASDILLSLGYPAHQAGLAKIAGYIHDIGNMVNRHSHCSTGAMMAFSIFTKMGADPEDIATVVNAVGNHDEELGIATSPVAAALIIADKTDVHRSRVRNEDIATFDIHDRVNYAVETSKVIVNAEEKIISAHMCIDTNICSVMDYFEIFLTRMLMCKRAANYLGTNFELWVNDSRLL